MDLSDNQKKQGPQVGVIDLKKVYKKSMESIQEFFSSANSKRCSTLFLNFSSFSFLFLNLFLNIKINFYDNSEK